MNDKDKDLGDVFEAASGGDDSAKSTSATLVDKIRETLANTSAERWERGGEALDQKKRFPRPRDKWEELFCTDTKAGVLVLRRSTPIQCNFFGGGYHLVPTGAPRYVVELRGRGWSPKMLLDPNFRGAGGAEKSMKVLAEDSVAQQMYQEVEAIVAQFRESRRREFNDTVSRLSASIKERVGETVASDWRAIEGEMGFKGYATEISETTVTVGQTTTDLSTGYSLMFSQYGLEWNCRDPFLTQEVFKLVDDSIKTASLEQLGKVLEEML
jgi:hypothetical protein